ncbi:peptidoglycan D,D-transpeptidase FtsI family protein [Helicobacter pametensis]|uniref:peptidoglycan D,D-transpeptidase FtsI family protein n=1 Tax=Helicobacter pametensis TaxID=95149 RepID=UPI0004B0AD8A|nr:penicillin-binding protein 2 [Helicobacter pametensis]
MSQSSDTQRVHFLILLFLGIGALLLIALFAFFFKAWGSDKRPPNLKTTKIDHSIRGNIYSSDKFTLATSEKLYKVSINPKSIDPNKKELFVNLFSIYSGIPRSTIISKLNSNRYTTLSYNISTITAANLKLLNTKLDRYRVFREYEEYGRVIQKMGIDLEVSGYRRNYPYGDTMEPILGYTQKIQNQRITKVSGVKGSEKNNNQYLQAKQDGTLSGFRDVGFNVIRNKYASSQAKQDGIDITLTIPLSLQKRIETILDTANQKLQAKEILVGVMDSKSGRILTLASSKRFDPKNIKKDDYSALNISATEVSFEPGSIIKPVIYAILLQKNLIPHEQKIFLHNGAYRIGRYIIRDDHPLKEATPEEILLRSSNIGMIKLTQNLASKDFLDAMHHYGFGEKTNIDLPQEASGVLPSIKKLKGSYKASVSYGYGFRATFIQLLRAYASFSNGGYLITPRIISHLSYEGELYRFKTQQPTSIISSQDALEVQDILRDIIKEGTGRRAKVEGIDMGGKTGTARIFVDQKYTKRYNSSFFGFAQDSKNSYTIGVVIFDPNVEEGYYGSKTAAPLFKNIVELLIQEKYLTPTSPQALSDDSMQTKN